MTTFDSNGGLDKEFFPCFEIADHGSTTVSEDTGTYRIHVNNLEDLMRWFGDQGYRVKVCYRVTDSDHPLEHRWTVAVSEGRQHRRAETGNPVAVLAGWKREAGGE